MLSLRLALLLAVADAHRLLVRTAPPVTARGSVVMRSWTPADMKSKALPLPDDLESLLSAATDRRSTTQLWAAFRSCYATEDDAIEAAKRNTGTILSYLNSPGNIYGSYAYMVEELGVDGAREVCKQNPGVLQCDPRALRQTTGEEIVRAARLVDAIESIKLPPVVRAAPLCLRIAALGLTRAPPADRCATTLTRCSFSPARASLRSGCWWTALTARAAARHYKREGGPGGGSRGRGNAAIGACAGGCRRRHRRHRRADAL